MYDWFYIFETLGFTFLNCLAPPFSKVDKVDK
jgi:hypothetical protein